MQNFAAKGIPFLLSLIVGALGLFLLPLGLIRAPVHSFSSAPGHDRPFIVSECQLVERAFCVQPGLWPAFTHRVRDRGCRRCHCAGHCAMDMAGWRAADQSAFWCGHVDHRLERECGNVAIPTCRTRVGSRYSGDSRADRPWVSCLCRGVSCRLALGFDRSVKKVSHQFDAIRKKGAI